MMIKKHNRLKRIAILVTLAILLAPMFSTVYLAKKANAAQPDANKNPWTVYGEEFKAWAGTKALARCLNTGITQSVPLSTTSASGLKSAVLDNVSHDENFNTGSAYGNKTADSSLNFEFGTEYYTDCDTEEDLNFAAVQIGYDSLSDALRDIWKLPSDGGVKCDGAGNPSSSGQFYCPRADIATILHAKATAAGRVGYDDNAKVLSPQGIFWYWNTVYFTAVGDKNGCGGDFYDDANGSTKSQDKPSADYYNHLPSGQHYDKVNTSSNTVATDRTWAIWDTDANPTGTGATNLEVPNTTSGGLNGAYGATNNGRALGCKDIAALAGNNKVGDLLKADYTAHCSANCDAPTTDTNVQDHSGTGGSTTADVCESMGWSLAWLACPILNGINSFLDFVRDKLVDLLLLQDSNMLQRGDACGNACGIYVVWVQFKTLANIFFVIIALIIILSQALNLEVISAYTAKKALPRLFIAAIGVQFSWLICVYMVQLTNALGGDIEGLMYAPFGGADKLTVGLSGASAGIAGLLLAATTAGIVIAGAFAVFLPLFLAALLAVFAAFFVLVARQAVLLLLIATAPLAFTAFVLPHTQKLAKLWWDFFSKGLVMYPLIIMLIASGRIFGSIVSQSNSATGSAPGFFYSVIGFISIYAPYFLIPATFKFAGGLIGNLGGFVNDRSRGIVDRSKKKRDAKVAENFAKFKQGNRFDEGSLAGRTLGKGLNTVGRGYGTGVKGRFGLDPNKRDAAMGSLTRQAAAEKMKDPGFIAMQHQKDVMQAATYNDHQAAVKGLTAKYMKEDPSMTEEDAAAKAKKAADSVQSTVGFSQATQYAAAQQLINNKTDIEDAGETARIIARVGRGSEEVENSLRGYNNAYAKTLGRNDSSDISTDDISVARAVEGVAGPRSDVSTETYNELASATGPDGVAQVHEQHTQKAHIRGYATGDTTTVVRGNERNVRNITAAYAQEYEEGQRTGNVEQMATAKKALVELERAKDYATGKGETYVDSARETYDTIDKTAAASDPVAPVRTAEADKSAQDRARGIDRSQRGGPGDPNDPRNIIPPPTTP